MAFGSGSPQGSFPITVNLPASSAANPGAALACVLDLGRGGLHYFALRGDESPGRAAQPKDPATPTSTLPYEPTLPPRSDNVLEMRRDAPEIASERRSERRRERRSDARSVAVSVASPRASQNAVIDHSVLSPLCRSAYGEPPEASELRCAAHRAQKFSSVRLHHAPRPVDLAPKGGVGGQSDRPPEHGPWSAQPAPLRMNSMICNYYNSRARRGSQSMHTSPCAMR